MKLPIFVFDGGEIVGAILVPTLVMAVLVAMPYLGRSKGGHRFNLGFLWAMLGVMASLTYLALDEDRNNAGFRPT